MKLVIVESPTKARTISQFLDKDYTVESSFGHVRDLPQKYFGIDIANDFTPKYTILPKAKERVKELKGKAKKAEEIILATDEDREGEAIAWHLLHALGLLRSKASDAPTKKKKAPVIQRIAFHEITQGAIDAALKNPRIINQNLVDAQQARRILDRMVGYKLSPFLWQKVAKGLSAGRVQSVAVRLIAERETEIENFKPEEYWTITAILKTQSGETFETALIKIKEETIEKLGIKTKDDAERIVRDLANAEWLVHSVEKKSLRRSPPPPFTTSTLQQEASRRLRFSAKQTMMAAQRLYEGVEINGKSVGLITYMRTDSFNVSEDFLGAARDFITREFGETYTSGPRRYKTKKAGAQEAHEAIRPTDITKNPQELKDAMEPRLWRVYDLIWRRAVASQMTEAIFDTVVVDITTTPQSYTFRANGSTIRFDGFLKVWPTKIREVTLPPLQEQEKLICERVDPAQHFTEPPPRYTEATLVKALEEFGIGRPSTYAPILSTIQDRGYIEKDQNRYLHPTNIGKQVNRILVEHFPDIVDTQFTANMEKSLDGIAQGTEEMAPVLRAFWDPFSANIATKYLEVPKEKKPPEMTKEICEKCGKHMVIRESRFGRFLACSGFPECRNTKSLPQEALGACPKCHEGNIIQRRTKKRRTFYGCSRYPACDFASWQKPEAPVAEPPDNTPS